MIVNKIMGEPHINMIVGMKEEKAIDHLKNLNKSMRVINRDGTPIMVKGLDVDMDRVNVFVNKGIVINLDKLG